MSTKITRQAYAEMFGPTAGDRLRLADTELIIGVEMCIRDRPGQPLLRRT